MRILFVTFFFPPYNQMGAARLGKYAKFLIRQGHDVRVLCAERAPVPATLELEIEQDRVHYTRWFNINALPELLLGGREKVVATGFRRPGIVGRVLGWLGMLYAALLNIPDGQVGWFPYAVARGSRLIQQWRPDVIYASTPPATGLLVGRALARRHQIPWVAEMRDLWVDNPVQRSRGHIRMRIEHWLERRTLGTASGFVTISQGLAATMSRRYAQPVAVVENGFDIEDSARIRDRGPHDGPLRLVFTGMVYPEFQKNELLFDGLKSLGNAVEIAVDFYGRNLSHISQLVQKYGMSDIVRVHPPVPHRAALSLQREADALLFFSWEDPAHPGIMSGKIFEYLGARRPIMMIGTQDIEVTRMIEDREAGRLYRTAAEIAQRLRAWAEMKRQGRVLPDTPDKAVAGISREEQATRLASFLQCCVLRVNQG